MAIASDANSELPNLDSSLRFRNACPTSYFFIELLVLISL